MESIPLNFSRKVSLLFIDNGTQYHEGYQVIKQLFFANHSNVENSNINRNMKKKKKIKVTMKNIIMKVDCLCEVNKIKMQQEGNFFATQIKGEE